MAVDKPDPKNPNNKAPISGSNTKNDDKATSTGQVVNPKRPKSE